MDRQSRVVMWGLIPRHKSIDSLYFTKKIEKKKIIEAILDFRVTLCGAQFLVNWKNMSHAKNTWEYTDVIVGSPDLLTEYRMSQSWIQNKAYHTDSVVEHFH